MMLIILRRDDLEVVQIICDYSFNGEILTHLQVFIVPEQPMDKTTSLLSKKEKKKM